MKKFLTSILAFVLVFTMSVPVFAAGNFEDVTDKNVAKAVDRLAAFGIVDGFEDGTYRPGDSVTREQFAKLLVTALGLDSAAEAGMGSTAFADVAADRWSAGYINVAIGQGLIKGYPDGTFKPANQVKYSEAITMLVRALGYKDEFLPGSWPGNYIAKAAQLDITDKVKFAANGFADRGSAAVLVNNTLDANIVEQKVYGSNNDFEEVGVTLMERKLNVTTLDGVTIASVPRVDKTLNDDEIRIGTTKYTVAEGFSTDMLLGLSADVYVNSDDEVFYFEVDDNFTAMFDVISKDGTDSNVAGSIDDDDVELIKIDDDYDLATGALFFVDNKKVTQNELETAIDTTTAGLFAKIVLDEDGKVSLVDAFNFTQPSRVVTSVDETKETIDFFFTNENTKKLKLGDFDAYAIFMDGAQVALGDLEADDVINVAEATHQSSGDEYAYVFVTRDSVEGTLEAYKGTSEATIEGEDYDFGLVKTISLDKDEVIAAVSTTLLEDALDEEVVAILDFFGDVRHIRTDSEATSDTLYGIVINESTTIDGDLVKLYNQNGEEVVYEVTAAQATAVAVDDFVSYKLDSDGEIDTIAPETVVYDQVDQDGFDGNKLFVNSNEYFVEDDVVVFDIEEYISSGDSDDIATVSWEDIKDKGVPAGTIDVYVVVDSKGVVEALLFSSGLGATTDDDFYGYVLDVRSTSDGDKVKVAVSGEADLQYYYLASSQTVTEEDTLFFTLNKDGELTNNNASATTVTGYVYDIDGDYVKLDDGNWYKVDTNTIYYDEDDAVDYFDVDDNDQVKLLLDGRLIKVLSFQ